jgi:serine/threonine protein kinase
VDNADWNKTKSLFHQALDLRPEERGAFFAHSCNGDRDLRARVESLMQAHEEAGDFISAPALAEAGLFTHGPFGGSLLAGKRIGSYEIVRELGRGGMGAVYLAERADEEFKKRVALKIIKRGMDTESILRRFMIERQILANLEHENIARFLDGGTTEDGLPYFVMEYIEGEPITRYSDVHDLNTTERLQLFQKACAAVQHAHQNLIVHRDLKPSNILVTAAGAPKLLDFGIAKILSPDGASDTTEQTASALRLMTPEYASPEQLRGLPITTSTDVYSLGIVLYELLSGHRPYRFPNRSPEEIVRVVLTALPSRPSDAVTNHEGPRVTDATETNSIPTRQPVPGQVEKLRRRLLGDLDNIVLKALRKDRERRYSSVQEFSEDIRRHLHGLPVSARPDAFSYRAGKFIQRNRTGVAIAALVLVTLLSATLVTSWQAYVARREHAKAELRSAEQRKLASSLIYEVQTSLRETSHSLTAQKLLAQKSIEYLNNLAKDAGDDPKFLGELADAYRNLGYLQAWTLQDNTSALLTYQRAIDLARRRIAIEPKSTAALRLLADALGNRIESLNLLQRPEDTAATYSEKLPIEEQLSNQDPQDPEGLMRVAETAQAYGETLQSIHQDDEAKALFQKSIELGTRSVELFKAQTNTPQQRVDLALMQEKLASMFEKLDEGPEAIQTYREAVATASAVHAEHPEIVQGLRNSTSSHWYLGLLLDRQGDHRGALENYRASLKAALDATAADPSIDPWRGGEMKYSIVVGKALCKLGETKEGVPLIRNGIELQLRLIESDKGNRQDTYYGSEVLGWAVEGLAAAGLRDEAKTVSLKMIDWAEETAQNAPEDGGPRLHLVLLYQQLGDVYAGYDSESRKIGRVDSARLVEARRWYLKALDSLAQINDNYRVSQSLLQDHMNLLQERISQCDALPQQ